MWIHKYISYLIHIHIGVKTYAYTYTSCVQLNPDAQCL